ncbi:MAG TPA: hypothetical protein VLM17_04530 [Xanthomonadaceae bacterium]|nr:hypothetical protein [Xanthomonadaceae bacterium]
MSFEALIDKVKQAEAALEAHERQASADWRQLKASWTQLWTPGRLLLAGIGSGAAIGLLEPGKRLASGRGTLQMLSAVAGLFAGGSAQVAAGKAEDAADQAAQATAADDAGIAPMAVAEPVRAAANDPEALRRAGLL